MNFMKYDGMNLGATELALGINYLQEEASNITFPFLSTNLTSEKEYPFLKQVVIKDVGGFRVAILGAMPVNAIKPLNDIENKTNLKVLPPIQAIKERMSELKKTSDFIVLLSQLPQDQLKGLLNEVDGIDLVISCHHPGEAALTTSKKISSVTIEPGGLEIGYLKIEKDDKGHTKIIEEKKVILDKSVPRDEKVRERIEKNYVLKIREEKDLERRKQIDKEARQLWELTPDEYLNRMHEKGK